MNNDSNNDLARYHGFPPLTPHKPTQLNFAKSGFITNQIINEPDVDYDILSPHKPTPTIPQMEDRHERQVFTYKAERVVNQVLAFALTVLAVVFVGGLMYKTFVWGH
jgi:hypothetical protein